MEDWEWEKIGRVFFHRALGAPFLDFWVAIADLGAKAADGGVFLSGWAGQEASEIPPS